MSWKQNSCPYVVHYTYCVHGINYVPALSAVYVCICTFSFFLNTLSKKAILLTCNYSFTTYMHVHKSCLSGSKQSHLVCYGLIM